jgi:cytochrome c peroxidase
VKAQLGAGIVVIACVTIGTAALLLGESEEWVAAGEIAVIRTMSPVPPAPLDDTNSVADSSHAAALGRALFFDKRLSHHSSVSCATCHRPEQGWSDGRQIAKGIRLGTRHTPSLWNVAFNRWFFWDGRADTLWSQSLQPIENPDEMDGSPFGHCAAGT